MKPEIKNYFTITKTEWNGLVVLVILLAGTIAAPYLYRYYHKNPLVNFSNFDDAIAQLERAGKAGQSSTDDEPGGIPQVPVRLFVFNPNKLSAAQWQKLGLTNRQIKGIKNYEAKGGRFYTKADVQKMYTLSPQDYNRLQPYINLPEAGTTQSSAVIVELNTADSAMLTRLKGIGPAFARRIVQYRQRLGGFYSKQQLTEVYGMDDMRFKDIAGQFRVDKRRLKKLNVNTAEFDDLKNFPYLGYKQVNALIQYRREHGNYENFDELANVAILDAATLKKMKPYVVIK